MQQIDFHFNVANRSLYACRLLKKVTGMGLTSAVWSSSESFLSCVYDDLWRFEDLTFIAHAWAGSQWEAQAPVVFSTDIHALGARSVIVLLDENVPDNWQHELERFERVIDIVSTNPTELQNSRQRYRVYHAAGIALKAYDRSKG